MKKISVILCLFPIVQIISAQQKVHPSSVLKRASMSWGIIGQEDMSMKVYPLDSSADAVVLDNYGEISITIDPELVHYKTHKRIKIFKKSAFESEGLVRIPYYTAVYANKEEFETLRAQIIYNDGTIRPLNNKDFLDEKVNENFSVKKILFPALQEGCILEYEFSLTGKYSGPFRHDWNFQENIPTRYSDLKLSIPGYYGVVFGRSGDQPIKNIPESDETERTTGDVRLTISKRHLYADSVPAVKADAFMTTLNDYTTTYHLQLREYIFPGEPKRPYMKDWDGFTRELYDGNFGNYSRKKNYSDAWVALTSTQDLSSLTTDSMKIETIHRFVKNNMDWNDEKEFYPQESMSKIFKQKKGNSADINMLLVALLNEAGIKAFPLILGTRSHGKPIEEYPLETQYNYLLCYTELNGKPIFLDATDPLLPVNMPRLDALNGRGVVMDKKNPHWIDIVAPTGTVQRIVKYELDNKRNISGSINTNYKGYDALIERHKAGSTEAFEKATKTYFTKILPDIQIDSITKTNLRELNEPYRTNVYFKLEDAAGSVGDVMYLTPTMFFDYRTNPFIQKERNYPIDIPYKQNQQLVVILKIPEDYIVTDMPKNIKLVLPGSDASFQYFINNTNNTVQATVKLNINRLQYSAENYKPLKDFFDQVAAKVNEPIVLKKK